MFYNTNNRYLCDVLEEMRKMVLIYKDIIPISSYRLMSSLIEEIQIMGNRMEASINDLHDRDSLYEDIKEKKKELKLLKEEIKNHKE